MPYVHGSHIGSSGRERLISTANMGTGVTAHVDARHKAAVVDAHTGRQTDTRRSADSEGDRALQGSGGKAGAGWRVRDGMAAGAAADALTLALGHSADRAGLVPGTGAGHRVCDG